MEQILARTVDAITDMDAEISGISDRKRHSREKRRRSNPAHPKEEARNFAGDLKSAAKT